MYKYIYLLLFLLLSCKGDTILKKNHYYKNGNISREYEYMIKNGDTILDGVLNEYSLNSKLRLTLFMKNDHIINSIEYYPNGTTKYKAKYKNDKTIEGLRYRRNGKLKTYLMWNERDKVKYKKKYDSLGNIISTQGKPIIELVIGKSNSPLFKIIDGNLVNIKLLDTIKFTYTIANPPNTKVTFKVIEKKSNNRLLDIDVKTPHNTFYKVFKEKKEIELLGIVKMHDFDTDTIVMDTIPTKILWDKN